MVEKRYIVFVTIDQQFMFSCENFNVDPMCNY